MSHLTALVMMLSDCEEDSLGVSLPPLAALQAWLRRADVEQLVAVDQLFGGKNLGIVCLGGGSNYFDVEGFVELFLEQESRPLLGR